MNVDIQSHISPLPPPASKNRLAGDGPETEQAKPNAVDFKSLLLESNAEVRKTREAQSKGDLSKAKNYEEFLDSLNAKRKMEGAPRNTLEKNDFLKLFVTQLQQQDPLNPKDGAEMASQLAQFNSLEQMTNVNETLMRLEKGNKDAKAIHFINYLGKEIGVDLGRVNVEKGSLGKATFELKAPMENLKMELTNSTTGQSIFKGELGSFEAGVHQIPGGILAKAQEKPLDGVYNVKIFQEEDGKENVVPIKTYAVIDGVDLSKPDGGFRTKLGAISFGDIKELSSVSEKTPSPVLVQKAGEQEAKTAP